MPLLLLDLDNTVADRAAAFEHWLGHVLAAWAPDDAEARAFLVDADADGFRPRLEFLAMARERLALSPSADELLSDYRRITLEGFPPIEAAVRQRLASLRAHGWKLAVVTNGEAGVQEATARRVGIDSLVDACVVSDVVRIRKPDPRIFELAAEMCGHPLAGAWMVGDGDPDVIGAHLAGIRSVWLARGRTWERTDVEPTAIAHSMAAALDHIASAA